MEDGGDLKRRARKGAEDFPGRRSAISASSAFETVLGDLRSPAPGAANGSEREDAETI
jgi:hypothetical protein